MSNPGNPAQSSDPVTETVVGDPRPIDPPREFVIGDNLDALADWGRRFPGQVALVLADPPYNAKNIKDYQDDFDHGRWIEEISRRIDLCLPLLRPDGILAVHIDDSEHAYLQILLDRAMGRTRRLNTVVVKMSELAGVKMRYSGRMLPRIKEYVLFYGNGPDSALRPLRRRKDGASLEAYLKYYGQFLSNPDDPLEDWKIVPVRQAMDAAAIAWSRESEREFKLRHAHRMVYRTNNRWFDSLPPEHRPRSTFARMKSPWEVEYLWWEGKQVLFLADHLDEPLSDVWTDISTINVQREGGVSLRSSKKPEALVHRILELCTSPGDLVADPWSGSATTSAVAHKTGRGWLACEVDLAIARRALTRMETVVSGADRTGVTTPISWKGGGGFTVRSMVT